MHKITAYTMIDDMHKQGHISWIDAQSRIAKVKACTNKALLLDIVRGKK